MSNKIHTIFQLMYFKIKKSLASKHPLKHSNKFSKKKKPPNGGFIFPYL